METLIKLDLAVLTWLHDTLSCALLDAVMPFISLLGDNGIIWIALALALIFTKKYRRCGIFMLCGLVAGVIAGNVCLKNLIARPRPRWLDTSVELLVANPTDYSFPSGHFIERKGLLDFIELARKNPQRSFFWFGYTNLKLVPDKIRRAIEAAPKNLIFPGFVDSGELIDAYCGCDLFLFMSHEETEGIVVLEALSCKIPVLVRDIPVYGGWLYDAVNAYTADSAESFQSKLDGILSGDLPRLCEAGRATAEERSIPRTGAKLMEIYNEMKINEG